MHRVPKDRRDARVLDSERVCRAIDAIAHQEGLSDWADLFSLLGDRTRLQLLIAICTAGPISVTDLSVATGIHDTTVSQSLRFLRAAGAVISHRDGRIMRYELADAQIRLVLEHIVTPTFVPALAMTLD